MTIALLAFAPPADAPHLLALAGMHLVVAGLLRHYFINQLRISQGFQDYAATCD